MTHVRRARSHDHAEVASRIAARLGRAHESHPAIDASLDDERLLDDLATSPYWVAVRRRRIVGHLAGRVVDEGTPDAYWVGLDGLSYDDTAALATILGRAARVLWRDGVTRWHLTVPDDADEIGALAPYGFSPTQRLGSLARVDPPTVTGPGVRCRRADADAAELLARASDLVDLARGVRPSTSADPPDPTTVTWVAETDRPAGVAAAFPRLDQRGVAPRTWHLTTVAVEPDVRRRGVGRALVGTLIDDARGLGARGFDVSWDPADVVASAFWGALGFDGTTVVASADLVTPATSRWHRRAPGPPASPGGRSE